MTTFNARLGAASLAAASYALQIMSSVIVFADSIGLGTEILIGHLIGQGDLERAYRNVAVHDYQRLNLEIVGAIVERRLVDLQSFARVALALEAP